MHSITPQVLLAANIVLLASCPAQAAPGIQPQAHRLEPRATPTSIDLGPLVTAAAIDGCNKGLLANPTADNWNNFQIDTWFQAVFWDTYPLESQYINNDIPYILEHVYGRTDLECPETQSCTANIGDCSSWLQTAPNGPMDAIQAYIWYYGWAQLQSLMSVLFVNTQLSEGQIGIANTDIASTFGNPNGGNPPWDKYGGELAPALGALSGVLGVLDFGAASGILGVFSGLAGSIMTSVGLGDPAPKDPRVTDTNEIGQALWTVFDDLSYGISQFYESVILLNNGTGGGYPSLQSVLQGGSFADASSQSSIEEQLSSTSLVSNIQQSTKNIMLYTAVNTLWRDADVFIVYIPYNVKIDQYNPFTASDCSTVMSNNAWKYASCDGLGMSLLVGDVTKVFGDGNPPGVDETDIETGVSFSWSDVLASSVNGWLASGFNATIDNPIYASTQKGGTLTVTSQQDLTSLGDTSNSSPGLFNIPVCQIYSFGGVFSVPLANTPAGNNRWCHCLEATANGGPNQLNQRFTDYAPAAVVSEMSSTFAGGKCYTD